MSSGKIRAITLGTYYSKKGTIQREHEHHMRELVYHAKNEWDRSPTIIEHPRHPGGRGVAICSHQGAHEYFAEIVAAHLTRIRERLDLQSTEQPLLVPIPTSSTTVESQTTCFWPAKLMAQQLEKRGFGRVFPAVVFKAVRPASHAGGPADRKQAHVIASEMVVVQPVPPNARVTFIDDVITWGSHLAAADSLLPSDRPTALAIATTDKGTEDAYTPRHRVITWDTFMTPWWVSIYDAAPDARPSSP